jgi:outer membrane immunogenic protein
MSRIHFLGASLIAIAASTAAAQAADLGYQPPPVTPDYSVPQQIFSWNGGYIGIQGGYDWTRVKADDGAGTFSANGWQGGIYGGYNFQAANNFVLGVEGDANLKSTRGNNGTTWYDNPWDASLRLRAGFAVDRFLIYGAGGATVGKVKAEDVNFSDSKTKVGWNIGAGVEAKITESVVGRVEFRHTDLGSSTYDLTVPTDVSSSSNAVLVGVGMKF